MMVSISFAAMLVVFAIMKTSHAENVSENVSEPDFYVRKVAMHSFYNGLRWDDLRDGGKASVFALTSASLGVGMQGLQADFFAASLSNIVYPKVCYAYYTKEVDVNFDANQHELSLETSATGMATVFTKLFQFIDKGDDGEYTEGTDDIVDEYSFVEKHRFLKYAKPKPAWDLGDFSRSDMHAKIKTKDGVFAVVMKGNGKSGRSPGGSALTPMNTKVDVEINYPDLQDGNLVGLETYVVSTKASATVGLSYENGFYIPQDGALGSLGFTWDSEADFDGSNTSNGIKVRASAVTRANLSDLESNRVLLGAIGASKAFDGSLEVDKIIFSFNTPKAGKILWDPTVGINEPDMPTPTAEPTVAPTSVPTVASTVDSANEANETLPTDGTNDTLVSAASGMPCREMMFIGVALLLASTSERIVSGI